MDGSEVIFWLRFWSYSAGGAMRLSVLKTRDYFFDDFYKNEVKI